MQHQKGHGVTEFTKIDSFNPFQNHIKNCLLNVTFALSKGEAAAAFVPEYLEPFRVSESLEYLVSRIPDSVNKSYTKTA